MEPAICRISPLHLFMAEYDAHNRTVKVGYRHE